MCLSNDFANVRRYAKAAEAYKNAIEADWSGEKPSPTLLKGLVDALDKDGRYGLSLEYVKNFRDKAGPIVYSYHHIAKPRLNSSRAVSSHLSPPISLTVRSSGARNTRSRVEPITSYV